MESKVNYTLVGVTVAVLTAGLIIAGLWLSTGFDKKQYLNYLVFMNEPVSGLSEESPVKFNGVKVGQVSQIEFSHVDPQQTKILIKVEKGTPITQSTFATLITQGITGTTSLGLAASSSSFIPLQKTPGHTFPVIPSKPSFMNQLQTTVNEVSLGVKQLLSKQNIKHFKDIMSEMPKLINDLRVSSKEFNALADSMSLAGHQVTDTMQAGKEGIDKITNQTLPPAIILMQRLDVIAANLEQITQQMTMNPGVLIRGTKPLPPGPGE